MTCITLPIISRWFAHSTLQIRAIRYASRKFEKYSLSVVIYCKDVDGKLEKSRANTYHTHPCLFAVLDT